MGQGVPEAVHYRWEYRVLDIPQETVGDSAASLWVSDLVDVI